MKKVLIINGNTKKENQEFENYCLKLAQTVSLQGNEVRSIKLREKTIGDCLGCYACWLKTPGICAIKDDQVEILKGYVWSDFIVLASPLMMGFVSSLIKRVNDRIIPLAHPFLKFEDDRMTHYPRYDKVYNIGLLLDDSQDGDDDDIQTTKEIYRKAAFVKTTKQAVEEVAHEINNF